MRAIQAAGLSDLAERALGGAGLPALDLERLRKTDLLLVAGLADLVREKFRGDEVRIVTSSGAREPSLVLVEPSAGEREKLTGAELLVEVALVRLRTPGDRSVGVSFDTLGLELAQTALLFGADVLFGDLGGKRTLPLLDGPEKRKQELSGLIIRAGRSPRFVEATVSGAEQRS
jgi:hypothetical protein